MPSLVTRPTNRNLLRRYRYALVGLAATLLLALVLSPSAEANSKSHILARSFMPLNGGEIRAPGGWALQVPPETLKKPGVASITARSDGTVDFHIAAPWHGEVAVSMPLHGSRDAIAHHLDGVWVQEGHRGQTTVWVRQLSIFGAIKGAISGVTCISWDYHAVIKCLLLKGITKVNGKLGLWIAEKISDSCAAALIASGLTGGPAGIALGIFNDPPCVGTASSPGSPPAPKAPPSPSPPAGTPPSQPPTGSPSPPPSPPPPSGLYETTGGLTHTWTNYTNAGGYEGPVIPAYTTVLIACKLTGFRVADGNTWWYRIGSSPWNGAYYASADAFYNNGQTSGSLKGTPFVDPSVPDC